MALTAQDIIDRFRNVYTECSESFALDLMQGIDTEIFTIVPWRQASLNVGLVAGQQAYQIDESVIRVSTARLLQGNGSQFALSPTSVDGLDLNPQAGIGVGPSWRNSTPGIPGFFYCSTDLSGSTVGVWPTSQFSTLLVSSATNAKPIVITTTTDHGLSTGDLVGIYDVMGNTAANIPDLVGQYWSVTVLSDTTFSIPAIGNHAYVSGGLVMATNSPMMILDVTQHVDYGLSTEIPKTPALARLYVAGMCYEYARLRAPDEIAKWKTLYEADKAEQNAIIQGMSQKLEPRMQVVRQRPGGPRGIVPGRGGCGGTWTNWGNNDQ